LPFIHSIPEALIGFELVGIIISAKRTLYEFLRQLVYIRHRGSDLIPYIKNSRLSNAQGGSQILFVEMPHVLGIAIFKGKITLNVRVGMAFP
jgi:hypothetical protein